MTFHCKVMTWKDSFRDLLNLCSNASENHSIFLLKVEQAISCSFFLNFHIFSADAG